MSYSVVRNSLRRTLALGAATALVLGATLGAIPAAAEAEPTSDSSGTTVSTSGASPEQLSAGISADGLQEAILRDLGMTPEQFEAAGEQGKRAADVAATLRDLPGFVGISIKDGKIVVEGSGPELQARIAQLNDQGPEEIVLVDPPLASKPADPETSPATDPPSTPEPSSAPSPGPVPDTVPELTPQESPDPAPQAAPQAAPQEAESALMAASIDQLYKAYVREVGTSGLQAVAFSDGHFVIRTGGSNSPESSRLALVPSPGQDPSGENPPGQDPPGEAKMSPSEFVAKYANVKLEEGEPIAPEDDFYVGQGYYIDRGTVCSAGFSAFSPSGAPLVLTAGHCADDGAAQLAEVALPASEPAGGASVPPEITGKLGTFGFSQFGGPNNSWITGNPENPDTIGNIGTDIAVIEGVPAALKPQPAATQWGDPSDLGASSVKIVGSTQPFQGQSVCRSGRTSGWSCGTVDELGIYVMGGHSGLANDFRAIRGFLSFSVQSSGGDSGGPWISGNYAVGTHTAGDSPGSAQNFAVATTLNDAMTRLPGVQLEVFLNKPVLTNPASCGVVAEGEAITGLVEASPATSVPTNSSVRIIVPGQDPFEVPVEEDGSWQFQAPSSGNFSFTAETVNGFSRSGDVSFEVVVGTGLLLAPVVTSPEENAARTSVEQVEGRGAPGATVQLTGDITGSATVSEECSWSVPVEGQLSFGKLAVTAIQAATGMQDSPPATRNFSLVPPTPSVTNVQDGQRFAWDAVPTELTGTGLDGALVTVEFDGVKLESVVADKPTVHAQDADALAVEASGVWSVSLPADVAAGAHTLAVTQSMEGVASAEAVLTFIVDPKPSVTAVLPARGGDTAGAGSAGRNLPTSYGWLALTGADGIWLVTGIGGSVLLVGSIALFAARHRRARR
ncbi:S1 family peptidase [Arthrobacter sp. R4-81]